MKPEELAEAMQSGKLGEAAAKLREERDQASGRGDKKLDAQTSNDLGVVLYTSGEYAEARTELTRARAAFAELQDAGGQARALGNLARVEEQSGDRKTAEPLYWQAAELFHQAGERDEEFATMRSLSQLYLKQGGYLQSLATFDHAIQIKPRRGPMEAVLHRIYQIPLRMFGIGSQ